MIRNRIVFIATMSLIVSAARGQSTYTGLSGYWDYQTNYRTNQYIRICPNTQMIHAVMMVADDSLNPSPSRCTAYAFSSNGGSTWNTFSDIRVPSRRSGFPTLDIAQGSFSCVPIIANHSTIIGLQSTIFVDSPPGTGAFSEVTPPASFGGDDPGFPEVAGAADESIIMVGSRFAAGSLHNTRNANFISWSPWGNLTLDFVADGFVVEANTTGRVGVVVGTPESALSWYESTNNGATWAPTPTQLLPDLIPSGSDTFVVQQGIDLVYLNNSAMVTFGVTRLIGGVPTQRDQGIGFWSAQTGFVLAVPHSSIPGVTDTLLKRQVNQNTVGYPAIGLSGPFIVIAFQAYMHDTSASGFNYGEVFITYSANNGATWSDPINISQSQFLDDRYPSMSKWNPGWVANLVWQMDTQPGASSFGDGSPVSRSYQKFARHSITMVSTEEEINKPAQFVLDQNYPNPFNPETKIGFRVSGSGWVSLKVFDVLGREVALLVNEKKEAGTHSVTFDASALTSGMYFYRLSAGSFTETKKLLLLK